MSEEDGIGARLREGLDGVPAPEGDLLGVTRRASRLRVRRQAGTVVIALVAIVGVALPLALLLPLGNSSPSPKPAATPSVVAGEGLRIEIPESWDGRVYYNADAEGPVMQLANFPLEPVPPAGPEDDVASRSRSGMGPGQVVVVMREVTSDCPCAGFDPADLPVSLHPTPGSAFEGIDPSHSSDRLTFTTGGRSFDLWGDFGSSDPNPELVRQVQEALATLQIKPAVTKGQQEGWVVQYDLHNAVAIEAPQDWTFASDPVPALIDPPILFALGTGIVSSGGECAPSNAIESLSPDGALLWVTEYPTPGVDGRPDVSEFPQRSGSIDLGQEQGPLECVGTPAFVVLFREGDRFFQADVVFGPDASASVRGDMIQALNSFAVVPNDDCVGQPTPGAYSSTFSATAGSPGDDVTVSGRLPFPPLNEGGEYVPPGPLEVWWNDDTIPAGSNGLVAPAGPAMRLATFGPPASCTYALRFTVPDVAPGTYPVTVRGYGGDGFTWIGWINFEVHGPGP
jgi:hypothetical protein